MTNQAIDEYKQNYPEAHLERTYIAYQPPKLYISELKVTQTGGVNVLKLIMKC